jgi:hypothetical protein
MNGTPVDGVEVKVTLTGPALDAGLTALALHEDDAEQQRMWFFDTVDPQTGELKLLTSGVVLRTRRKKSRKWTSTLKLRPAEQQRLVGDFVAGSDQFDDDFKVEYDWAQEPVLAASMDSKVGEDTVEEVLDQPARVSELYSNHQRRLLLEVGAPPPNPFAGLAAAGPISAHRWEDLSVGELRDVRAEHWSYGAGHAFLELSLRAPDLERAGKLREALHDHLAYLHLAPDTGAVSKTGMVLRDLLDSSDHPR